MTDAAENAHRVPRDWDHAHAFPKRWMIVSTKNINSLGQPVRLAGTFDDYKAAMAEAKNMADAKVQIYSVVQRELDNGWLRDDPNNPWSGMDWWEYHCNSMLQFPKLVDDGCISYLEDGDKRTKGVRTLMKIGRYLKMFVLKVHHDNVIREYTEMALDRTNEFLDEDLFPLKWADTAEDMMRTFAEGPRSCMAGQYFPLPHNPAAAYASGDWQVAYIEAPAPSSTPVLKASVPKGRIIARAVVCVPAKVFNRVYPTGAAYWEPEGFASMAAAVKIEAALKARLSRLGYDRVTQQNRSRVFGARLLLVPHHKLEKVAVLPSLDNSFYCNASEGGFVVAERGSLHGGTNGYVHSTRVTKEMRAAWGGLYIQPSAEQLKATKGRQFRIPFPDADERDLEMAAG